MKKSYSLLIFICFSQFAFSQYDKKIPARNKMSKSGIINRPIESLLPKSSSTFTQPTNIPNPHKVPQPAPMPSQPKLNYTEGKKSGATEDVWGEIVPPRTIRIPWNREIRGIRMFVDKGFIFGIGKTPNNCLNLSASAGFQFNPYVYTGIGLGYHIALDKKSSIPFTFHSKVNLWDADKTPFADFKIGYSPFEAKGAFYNPSVGMSFGKKKKAWNVGLGYVYKRVRFEEKGNIQKATYHGLSLNITFEFSIFSM